MAKLISRLDKISTGMKMRTHSFATSVSFVSLLILSGLLTSLTSSGLNNYSASNAVADSHISEAVGTKGETGSSDEMIPGLKIQSLLSRPGDDQFCSLTANETHLVAVWHSDYSGNYDIWCMLYNGSSWTSPLQLTTNDSVDQYPYAKILDDGRILVFWASARSGQLELWYKVRADGVWSPDRQLTTVASDWDSCSPVTQLADGSIALAWTSNSTGQADVWFAVLSLDSSGILHFEDWKLLTNANSTMWLFAESVIQTRDGKIWVFIYDLYNYDFQDFMGNITTFYYNVSADGGTTWSGDLLTQGSGIAQPAATELPNGTIMVVFEGDDLARGIPFSLWYMKLQPWSEPALLAPGEYLASPSATYFRDKIYVGAQYWINDTYKNDLFLITLPVQYDLSTFPQPFVSDGVLNSTVVIGTSDPHGPCGAAHTLDTVGGMGVTAVLGRYGSVADCRFYLDTDIAWYNETEWKVHYWPVEGLTNIITAAGPGVNMITWRYFCNPWYAPVYMYYDGGLGEWVVATPSTTYLSSDWIGTDPLRDLVILEAIYLPEEGRYVLWVGGFGGCATRAGCLALQLFDTGQLPFTLEGRAMLIEWIDDNGNAKVDPEDSWNIIETVP